MSAGKQRLVNDISYFFLGDESKKFFDVTLVSSDGMNFPSCRLLLAARSPYFSKLLLSDFQERNQEHVSMKMPARTLRSVLDYLISGTLPYDVNGGGAEIDRLHQLIGTADFIGSDAMQADCLEYLLCMIEMHCDLTCTLVERLYATEQMTIPEHFTARLLARIRQNPKQHVLVPTCLANTSTHSGALLPQSGQSDAENLGVLELGGTALGKLVKAEKLVSEILDEYWFQVIYFGRLSAFRSTPQTQFMPLMTIWNHLTQGHWKLYHPVVTVNGGNKRDLS